MLSLCVVQVLARSVVVWPGYRPKTAKNRQKNKIFGQFRAPAGVRSLVPRFRAPRIMDVKFQFLARGLWYLVLVPTST